MKLTHFFQKFSIKPTALLGIDVDHESLRLVELNKVGAAYFLRSCIQVPLPQNSAENFSWSHPEFSDFLKQAVQASNATTSQVALALPDTSVLFKTIELDKTLKWAEIAIQVRGHAEQYFNYPASELMMDFELLGESKNHPKLREVRWVAARRLEIASRIHVLEDAGLTALAVEVDSISLQRAARFFIQKNHLYSSGVAIIKIYFSYILLSVLYRGLPICTRVENYATHKNEDATLKIVSAIVSVLRFFSNSVIENNLSVILLSGGDMSADLSSNIQIETGIKTEYLDIFSAFTQPISTKEYQSHAFLVSIGLAMRKIV